MTPCFSLLTTYPPTQCGLATFAQALVTHLRSGGAEVGAVPVVDAAEPAQPLVVHQWVSGEQDAEAQHIDAGHTLAMKRRESVA